MTTDQVETLADITALPALVLALYLAEHLYRLLRRGRGQHRQPYAGFDTSGADTVEDLDCDGGCDSSWRPHFVHGDGTATCANCGAPRLVALPRITGGIR